MGTPVRAGPWVTVPVTRQVLAQSDILRDYN